MIVWFNYLCCAFVNKHIPGDYYPGSILYHRSVMQNQILLRIDIPMGKAHFDLNKLALFWSLSRQILNSC